MLKSEFEIITDIYPSQALYDAIEREYMDSKLDKHDFCRDYMDNKDGLAERCANAADREVAKALLLKEQKLTDENNKLTLEINAAKSRIIRLLEELEAEQEWRDYEDPRDLSDEDYKKRSQDDGVEVLTAEKATELIAKDLGFDPDKIHICLDAPRLQKNRHRQIREQGIKERFPLWFASDYHYIRFEVRGYTYELIDGDIHVVYT